MLGREFLGPDSGETVDHALSAGIDGLHGRGGAGGDGAYVDDAAVGRRQVREEGLCEEENTAPVEVDQGVPVVEGLLWQRLVDSEACVVDQDVDGAVVVGDGGVDEALRARLGGQVGLHGHRGGSSGQGGECGFCLGGERGKRIVEDDTGAPRRKLVGNGRADARVGACHDGDFAGECLVRHAGQSVTKVWSPTMTLMFTGTHSCLYTCRPGRGMS